MNIAYSIHIQTVYRIYSVCTEFTNLPSELVLLYTYIACVVSYQSSKNFQKNITLIENFLIF